MIGVPPRVLVSRAPVDFRKQIDGLASVCERELGEEPLLCGGLHYVAGELVRKLATPAGALALAT